jgi:2,5-diamino-6-(ribosylamino)-4(3H)-pyrimidinone 5'-phosphate reductase
MKDNRYANIIVCYGDADRAILTKQLKMFRERYQSKYGCERLTVQSGGTMNGIFLRNGLFDFVDIIVAPVLVGGKNTSTLIDGDSITTKEELSKLGVLRLISCEKLEDSYLRL